MQRQMEQMSLEAQLKMAGGVIPTEMVVEVNKMLNQIPKEEQQSMKDKMKKYYREIKSERKVLVNTTTTISQK